MALSDKNIVITPNRGSSNDPQIVFSGADASTAAQNITAKIYPTSNGTLSFEGSAGQLFSITNDFTGSIFSVNDVSGIPSIEVFDTGEVRLAQYNGYVDILNSTPATSTNTGALQVVGGVGIGGNLYVGGTIYGIASVSGTISTATNIAGGAVRQILYQTGAGTTGFITAPATAGHVLTWNGGSFVWAATSTVATQVNTVLRTTNANHYLTFVDSNNAAATAESVYTSVNLYHNPSTGTFNAPTFNATSVTNGGFQGIDADTAAIPSFTWSTDLNTGMWRPAADTVAFTTGGTERLRITSAGGISFGSSGTAYGTSGQILRSNGNASPTWVNASGISAGSATSSLYTRVLQQTDGTNYIAPTDPRAASGARGTNLNANQYSYGLFSEFKNSSLFGFTGNYTGLLTYANWAGTSASTGDPSYQLAFHPNSANATANPRLKFRAGIDTTWGAWGEVSHTGVIDLNIRHNSIGLNQAAPGTAGVIAAPSLRLNRSSFTGSGISWYSPSYTSWSQYMSPAGATGSGPTGNITAPSGTLVTSWALRSFIESSGGYGWTFESGAASGQPTVVAEIRSSDGSAKFNGGLNVGTASGSVTGEIRASNEITAYYSSDIRLKENIRLIADPIGIINQIRGVYYDWTDEHIKARGGEDGYFVRKHDIGVIAQEVEKVLPEIVAERDDGTKVVKYEKIVALLIEAVKSQQQQINQILEQVENLANK